MTDQPTLGELMRVIEAMRAEQRDSRREITGRIDRLVSQEIFDREVSRLDSALTTMASALGSETANRKEAVKSVRTDLEKDISDVHTRMDKVGANLKWMAAAIVLPVALFIANLVFAGGAG